jgi:hypothetical protein
LGRIASAAGVAGWVIVDPSNGNPSTKPLSGSGTNSPALGNGTSHSAAMIGLYADINGTLDGAPDVSLVNGQKVTLSGTAMLSGIVSSREQFRWGLFNESVAPFNAIGWRGFIASNSAGSEGGALRAKDAEPTTTYAQTGAAVNLQTAQDGDDFIDGIYNFTMSISRFGNELSIDASFTTAEDWTQIWNDVVTSAPNQVTYNFNRVGFLSGSGMGANQISFSNIDVTADAIDALTLEVATDGQNAGTMTIRNNRPVEFDIEYYEITSAAGSLNLSGWQSLDEQETADPELAGWEESAGNGATLLSEYQLLTTTPVPSSGSLPLGRAFNAAAPQDLKFHIGLADGSLVRGVVEYVPGILTGDYNNDHIVDAADFVVWRNSLGQTMAQGTGADGDGNGVVEPADLAVWRSHFGATSGPAAGLGGSSTVPELVTWELGALMLLAFARSRPLRRVLR